jgi:DNA-directed RNA polymerase specialized sigma54-like protein
MKLIKAIITHENGEQPYSDETIMKGISLVWLKNKWEN